MRLTDQFNAQCQVDLCCSNNHQSSIRTGYLAFSIDTVRLRAYVGLLARTIHIQQYLLDKLQQIKLLANIKQGTIEQRLKFEKRQPLLAFSSFEPNWN
jgi:hypothetical protein